MIMVPLVVLLLAFSGAAQTPARKKAAPRATAAAKSDSAWPLSSLSIRGNRIYTQQQVIAASGLKPGQPVSKPVFDEAHTRLMKTGAFEEVSYSFGPDAAGKGYDGVITVSEVEHLYSFRFEDLPATDAEIRQFLRSREPLFEKKIPGTREFLARISDEVKEFLGPKGLKDDVVGKIMPDSPGELTVLFRPTTPVPVIGEVRFAGNQVLSSSRLGNAFGLVAVGAPYTEKRVRELLDSSIRPLYESRGRMHAAFTKVETKKMANVDGLSVTVTVDEGPAYKLRDVKITGSSLSNKELLSAVNLKPGETVNFDEIRSGVDRLQVLLRKQGYMRSETSLDRQVDDKAQMVDVEYRCTEGRRFLMGKLTIEGLDVTTEPHIRRLWSMVEGKPFNAEYPQYFLDRVRADGYLENLGRTSADLKVNEPEGTVDVALYFAGAPPEPAQKKPPEPNF